MLTMSAASTPSRKPVTSPLEIAPTSMPRWYPPFQTTVNRACIRGSGALSPGCFSARLPPTRASDRERVERLGIDAQLLDRLGGFALSQALGARQRSQG